MTIEMYADRKGWDLGEVEVAAHFTRATSDTPPRFKVEMRIPAELSDDQRDRIVVIAHKCPVHRALLADGVEIDDSLELIGA